MKRVESCDLFFNRETCVGFAVNCDACVYLPVEEERCVRVPDGMTTEQAVKYIEHGAEMVYDKEWMRDYLKEIIEQGRGYECACIMLEKALTKSLAKLEDG